MHSLPGNVRAASYAILRRTWTCERCGLSTPVHAFMVPADHEVLLPGDEGSGAAAADRWESEGRAAVVFHIDFMAAAVLRRIRAETTHYFAECAPSDDIPVFANHCEHCGARIGDRELHEEFPSDFLAPFPADDGGVEEIWVAEPFDVCAAGFAARS